MIAIFVYLGSSLPNYVLANMTQFKSRFPDSPLVFIGDSQKVCDKVELCGFNIWKVRDPEDSWGINRNSMSHDPVFRNGFWFKTLARFFALHEYLKNFPTESVLLIESDVWISPQFPLEIFQGFAHPIAFPLATSEQGVASTFFAKDSDCLKHFLNFAEHRVLVKPDSTDVTILAEYRSNYPENTYILPSGPIELNGYNPGYSKVESEMLSDQKYFPNQIFDASTWGQFITGEDPRNSWGFRYLYRRQISHAVDPSVFDLSMKQDAITATINGVDYQINTLHIHSKDLLVFTDSSRVISRVRGYHGTVKKEIIWKFFLRFLPSRFKHILHKQLISFRRLK